MHIDGGGTVLYDTLNIIIIIIISPSLSQRLLHTILLRHWRAGPRHPTCSVVWQIYVVPRPGIRTFAGPGWKGFFTVSRSAGLPRYTSWITHGRTLLRVCSGLMIEVREVRSSSSSSSMLLLLFDSPVTWQ